MRLLVFAFVIALGACGHFDDWNAIIARNEQANTVMPQNYKAEILSLMRTYLNDPTNVREAFISDPEIKSFDGVKRYAVCLRYNAKKSGGQYAGNKDAIMTFRDGRLDKIIDATRDPREGRQAREMCKDMAMKPFAELEHLTR